MSDKPSKGHYFGVDDLSSSEDDNNYVAPKLPQDELDYVAQLPEVDPDVDKHHMVPSHNHHHPDGDHVNAGTPGHEMEEEEEEPKFLRRLTARVILAHVVGVEEDPEHKHHSIPRGCAIKIDRRQGLAVLVDKTVKQLPPSEIRKTWKESEDLSMMTPKRELGRVFGEGIYLYFDFIRYITITNVMLGIIMLMNIVPHFYYDGFTTTSSYRGNLYNFYLSSYSMNSYPFWLYSNIAAIILTFVFGPLLSIRTKVRFRQLFHHHDHEDKFKVKSVDVIKDKKGKVMNEKDSRSHHIRMFVSGILFVLMLLVSLFVCGIINMAQLTATLNNETSTLAFSAALTAFLLISNVLWQQVCIRLTKFERHYTWTSYRKFLTIKYYVWKIANVAMIFVSRYIVRIYFGPIINTFPIFKSFASDTNWGGSLCSLNADAEQFFILILADVTVVRAFSILGPLFKYKVWARLNPSKDPSPISDRGRPDFDVADEYLDILYRQFLVYYGMSVFPWIVYFGIIGNLIEYPADKWVLLYLSRTPPRLRGSMRSFLTAFMFLTALCAVVMFPQGAVWILTGLNYKGHCAGTIFGGNNTEIVG